MAVKHFVSKRGTVVDHNHVTIEPGKEIAPGRINKDVLDDLVRQRFVVRTNHPDEVETDPSETPGLVNNPPLPSEVNTERGENVGTKLETSGGGRRVASRPINPKPTIVGKWSVDPATLTGKTLDDINAMIVERDPDVKPLETREEAAAFLTQDFKGK